MSHIWKAYGCSQCLWVSRCPLLGFGALGKGGPEGEDALGVRTPSLTRQGRKTGKDKDPSFCSLVDVSPQKMPIHSRTVTFS